MASSICTAERSPAVEAGARQPADADGLAHRCRPIHSGASTDHETWGLRVKALVTGAAGFVGKHLRQHLEEKGDEVIGVDRHDGPDLLDAEGFRELVHRVQPEAIYHLGGYS